LSRGQRECFGFDCHIDAPERSYAAIELRRVALFKIDKEVADPWGKVRLEQRALGSRRSRPLPPSKPGHQFAKDRRVVFRFGDIG